MFLVNIDFKYFVELQKKMYKEIIVIVEKSKDTVAMKREIQSLYSRYIDLVNNNCNIKGVNISDMLITVQNLKGNKNSIVNG